MIQTVDGFSSPGNNPSSNGKDASFTLFDRFQAKVPADLLSIRKFDPRLISENDEDDGQATWVAVYRSSNNLPSVLVRDEFLDAMRVATTVQTDSSASMILEKKSISDSFEKNSSSTSNNDNEGEIDGISASSVKTPVAIAKLVPSKVFQNRWVIEAMRCSLKKEDTNDACDGGSEHVEALSVCLDELIIHHLQEGQYFGEGGIRCKGTLVSSKLLEDRGFVEVTSLEKDMATHLSSFDGAMKAFADRAVTTVSKNPGARDRALKILSLLGRSNENQDSEENQKEESINDDSGDDDEYDPWGSIKQFYTG